MTAAELIAEVRERGFAVATGLLDAGELAEVRRALARPLARLPMGRNDFEGHRTRRLYSLAGRGPIFERIALHPLVLAAGDALLDPGYLLTASQAIEIHPGETPQGLHTDDSFYPLARPRPALSLSTIWAVDDFTADNGATEVVPGSHRWGQAAVDDLLDRISFATDPDGAPGEPAVAAEVAAALARVEMPAGSAILFLGTLVHRGGRNRSARPRLALSNQYCQPWLRQQESFLLSIPRRVARRMPVRLQELLGYNIHPPFMGHVLGQHPQRLLRDMREG